MESTGVQKRPRVERDIRVMPEVVELNIQMEGPPKKPKAVESPVVHQSSSSAAFSAPSTSFASQDRFVLVDPATLRPDELPPGTVLLRSVQPVVNMPQPQQPVPANVPVQQLGTPCSADAEHSDLCKHRPRCSYYLRSQHLLKKHLKKTSRSFKYNSAGRGRGGRYNFDRLNVQVAITPLQIRISDDGRYEEVGRSICLVHVKTNPNEWLWFKISSVYFFLLFKYFNNLHTVPVQNCLLHCSIFLFV
ncbi:uncharacterized protein LOC124360826 isoform X2 [Homalodisca vitripennis]|uniref:uncharacterized protein LOC124360826 isoform X2 n=1 Tax=Homalodisca vitripennis TaxID=197043 RepID=UPI001EEBA6EF|nr:uncharacterized protein LOC124360826 isoform X2 [Homalodisca vitripennis]